jgi:phosphate transport system substrate-binding protein
MRREIAVRMPGPRPSLLSVLVAAALALGPARGAASEVLRISGSGSALGSIRQLATAFEKAHPGQAIRLLPSLGSSGAIKAVAEGALDIGISGRPLKPGEQARGLLSLTYARTAFVFAAGPGVKVASVTASELARIYRGETSTWPDGGRIRLVLRPDADVDTLFVRSISPELDAAVGLALSREGMLMAATNQDCNEMLARTPGSIGPTSLTQLVTESFAVHPLAWDGVAPTLQNLDSGAYPLSKPFRLVVRASPTPAVRRFIDFLGTAEAKRVLEQTGNLPLALPPVP